MKNTGTLESLATEGMRQNQYIIGMQGIRLSHEDKHEKEQNKNRISRV